VAEPLADPVATILVKIYFANHLILMPKTVTIMVSPQLDIIKLRETTVDNFRMVI